MVSMAVARWFPLNCRPAGAEAPGAWDWDRFPLKQKGPNDSGKKKKKTGQQMEPVWLEEGEGRKPMRKKKGECMHHVP